MTLYVIGPYDKAPDGALIINTTSRSDNWSRSLSPFFCGPCDLYNGYKSLNVENGYQFAKVFSYYTDDNGDPSEDYFKWAKEGWNNPRAVRYPMGRDVFPLYSFWDGEKLDYVEARKKIYIPLYSAAVKKTQAFSKLKEIYENSKTDLYLWCFDGYNHKYFGVDYDHVINNPNKKMGHSFVLAMLLEGLLDG